MATQAYAPILESPKPNKPKLPNPERYARGLRKIFDSIHKTRLTGFITYGEMKAMIEHEEAIKFIGAKGILLDYEKDTYNGESLRRESDKSPIFIQKTDEGFFISFSNKNDRFPYFEVLHELGHAKLHLDKMKVGERWYCNSPGYAHAEADDFALEFAMPKEAFVASIKSNPYQDKDRVGECNYYAVAEYFRVNPMNIRRRSRQLTGWGARE